MGSPLEPYRAGPSPSLPALHSPSWPVPIITPCSCAPERAAWSVKPRALLRLQSSPPPFSAGAHQFVVAVRVGRRRRSRDDCGNAHLRAPESSLHLRRYVEIWIARCHCACNSPCSTQWRVTSSVCGEGGGQGCPPTSTTPSPPCWSLNSTKIHAYAPVSTDKRASALVQERIAVVVRLTPGCPTPMLLEWRLSPAMQGN